MPNNTERSVAIITGASSGVGWASALRLARNGYDLCITARRSEPLLRLATEVERLGAACLVVPGDVTQDEDVRRVVSECLERFGKIDALINDAAVQVYARFEDYEWDEITRIMDVNFYGYLRFARAVLPHFKARDRGTIVNVLSVMAQGSLQYFSIYSAAKHALLGWAKCLELELHRTNIRIADVILPALNTPLYDHCLTKLDRAPKPLPPIYDVEIAAKAVHRSLIHPHVRRIPAFLQGRLILWTDYHLPVLGKIILDKIGARGQLRRTPAVPGRGNLWKPDPVGTGPRGTLPATPTWMRYIPLVAAAAFGIPLFGMLRRGTPGKWAGAPSSTNYRPEAPTRAA